MRDAYGREIPERLEKIFAGREELTLWCRELQLLRQRLLRMDGLPFARDLQAKRIGELLAAARLLVNMGTPLKECNCALDDRDCPKCRGSRWITATAQVLAGEALCEQPLT